MKKDLKNKYLIGIDEVGRGPIAGPVAVCAFVFLKLESRKLFRGVKESKQLTEEKREEWFVKILEARKKRLINFCVSFQSEKVIDKKGISFAIKKCLETSLKKLAINPSSALILLDGSLKAPSQYKNQKTIIKGDVKEQVIALASICAKVLRDRKMRKLAKKYPKYGFDVHKGYGTKRHYQAIELTGLCLLHRRSFLQKRPV
ncbi:MAG: ribonuclease HII [Patescibacteria group bacterium]